MSKKRVGFEKLGVVVRQGDGFRARAQYRDDAGRLMAPGGSGGSLKPKGTGLLLHQIVPKLSPN